MDIIPFRKRSPDMILVPTWTRKYLLNDGQHINIYAVIRGGKKIHWKGQMGMCVFGRSLLPSDKQESGESEKTGKTGVPVTASPRISTLSGTWRRRAGSLPHCPLCFALYLHKEPAIPLLPFPWFHLPPAKRADTMNVHSTKLIRSSCPL